MTAIEALTRRIESWTGIDLERGASGDSLRRFLLSRTRELGLATAEAYLDELDRSPGAEREALINAVTVSFSWFHRDDEQMRDLGALLRDGWPPGQALCVWVPGCASGEEPYTIAMLAGSVGRRVSILGTDISSASLARARSGRYGAWSLRELPEALRVYLAEEGPDRFRVVEAARASVAFEQHNLVDEPMAAPGGDGWDLVVCRNVLIYFRPDRADEVRGRLARSVARGGWLLGGASESLRLEPPGLRRTLLGSRLALHRPRELDEPPPRQAPAPSPDPPPSVCEPVSASALALVAEGGRLMKGHLPEAIVSFARARELDPLCVEAHLHLGIAFHLLGDATAAIPALRAALFLEPSLWPAAFYLALSYGTLGRGDEARREYQRVVERGGQPVVLEVRAAFADMEAWTTEVLALSKRRAAGPGRGPR